MLSVILLRPDTVEPERCGHPRRRLLGAPGAEMLALVDAGYDSWELFPDIAATGARRSGGQRVGQQVGESQFGGAHQGGVVGQG